MPAAHAGINHEGLVPAIQRAQFHLIGENPFWIYTFEDRYKDRKGFLFSQIFLYVLD